MDWAPWFEGPRCRACATIAPRDALVCEECGRLLGAIRVTDGSLELPIVSDGLAPGDTPLVHSEWLSDQVGASTVFVLDEGRNPTGHVSDRGMAVASAASVALGREAVGLASPGRTGVAAAAATAPFDLDVSVYVPSRAPFPTKAMINVHGGDMTVVGGRYPDAAERAVADSYWSLHPCKNPYARAGRSGMYEDVLDHLDDTPPDVMVVPAGHGSSVVALADIAEAFRAGGHTDTVPRFVVAQPSGCAPIVEAWAEDDDTLRPVESPDTICGELEIPDPAGGRATIETITETGGEGIAVPDPAALEAAVRLADESGISTSVAGGVAAAAATDLANISADDVVVVLNPGAGGLDADLLRSHLMGQGI